MSRNYVLVHGNTRKHQLQNFRKIIVEYTHQITKLSQSSSVCASRYILASLQLGIVLSGRSATFLHQSIMNFCFTFNATYNSMSLSRSKVFNFPLRISLSDHWSETLPSHLHSWSTLSLESDSDLVFTNGASARACQRDGTLRKASYVLH